MTEWRLTFRIETDEAGALQAKQMVKDTLEPIYGPIGSLTIIEWMHRENVRNHGDT